MSYSFVVQNNSYQAQWTCIFISTSHLFAVIYDFYFDTCHRWISKNNQFLFPPYSSTLYFFLLFFHY